MKNCCLFKRFDANALVARRVSKALQLIRGATNFKKEKNVSELIEFDNLWNYSKPTETEIKFRELLPAAEENLDYKLQLLTQIARTQGLQRKFEEAHATLDEVGEQLNDLTKMAQIRYYLERGRVFNSSKKKETALPLFLQAFDLAVQSKEDFFAVDAAHMLGIAEATSEKQMEWNLTALKLAEESENPKAQNWRGSLYNNIGWTFHSANKFDEALDMFKKALAFREEKGDASSIRIAKWCLARTYRSLGQLEAALEIQKALEAEFIRIPGCDPYVFEELAEIYLLKNMNDESRKYFALAFQELSKDEWFKANEEKRFKRIDELKRLK